MRPLRLTTKTVSEAQWRIVFRPARREGSLSAFIVVPDRLQAFRPPIVAVHGLARDAREQARLLARAAAAHGQVVIAPQFDEATWKRYQQVVVRGRADLALIALLAEIRAEYPIMTDKVVLTGFSGGAQFAHRFAMLHPGLVQRLVSTAAGWYTFPNAAPYPYGLGDRASPGSAWAETFAANLDEFVRLPIKVVVGAFDNVPDATLRRAAEIDDVQGTDRLTRARRWGDTLRTTATARGLEPRISLHILEDCAHDFAMCVRIGGLDRHIVTPAVGERGG